MYAIVHWHGCKVMPMQRIDYELRLLWPDAPMRECDPTGRWVSFAAVDGRTIYLQRYAWDEECRPHYLVVATAGEGEVEQHRFVRLDEAVDQLRALGVEPVPARAA
jgi:hypothetical protein